MMFSRDPSPLVLVLASRSAVPGSAPSFCRTNAERDAVRVCLGVSAGQSPLLLDGEGAYICSVCKTIVYTLIVLFSVFDRHEEHHSQR